MNPVFNPWYKIVSNLENSLETNEINQSLFRLIEKNQICR